MDNNSVCRICLNKLELDESILSIDSYAKTLNFENLLIKTMIEKTVPELDLDICESPIICSYCYDLLVSSYTFKSKCYQTEQRIYLYMEGNTFNVGNKIDLKHVTESFNTSQIKQEETINEETYNTNSEKIINIFSESDSDFEQSNKNPTEKRSDSSYMKRSYSCDKCEYKAYRVDLLKRHLDKCEGTKKTDIFKCSTCDYSTCRKRNLKRHELIHGGKRPYSCGICNKGFTEMNHIRSHMFKHSNSPLPFKCNEKGCISSFTRKCDLNAHIITHVKLLTFICDICKKSFVKKEQLNSHRKHQHRKKSEDE